MVKRRSVRLTTAWGVRPQALSGSDKYSPPVFTRTQRELGGAALYIGTITVKGNRLLQSNDRVWTRFRPRAWLKDPATNVELVQETAAASLSRQ